MYILLIHISVRMTWLWFYIYWATRTLPKRSRHLPESSAWNYYIWRWCWLDHITLYRNSNITKGKHPFSTFPAGGYTSEFVHQMFCICYKNLKACKLRARMHATNMTHIHKNNYVLSFTRPYMKCRALVELSIAPLRATDIHSTKGVSTASKNGAFTKVPSVDCIL